jgi:hypothetical protein
MGRPEIGEGAYVEGENQINKIHREFYHEMRRDL